MLEIKCDMCDNYFGLNDKFICQKCLSDIIEGRLETKQKIIEELKEEIDKLKKEEIK